MTQAAAARRSQTGRVRLRLTSPTMASGAALVGGLSLALAVTLTITTSDLAPTNGGVGPLLLAVFGTVGIVIVRHQPRNAVGWLLVSVSLIQLFTADSRLYLVLDYRMHHGDLPLGRFFLFWVAANPLSPVLLIVPAVLLFPDGRAFGRWRLLLLVYVVFAAGFVVTQLIGQSMPSSAHIQIDLAGKPSNLSSSTTAGVGWLVFSPLLFAFWALFVGKQVGQWRHSDGERREQLKWLMSGASVALAALVLLAASSGLTAWAQRVVSVVFIIGLTALPISIGIGILRYRLYEIDRIISRTLSYTIVTGLLVGAFGAVVLIGTDVLPFSSPVAVAASTLTVAALFNPLRRRTQRILDRRFNRARYDAETVVAAFNTWLRDAADIDIVQDALITAVTGAVAPSHLSVWMRPIRPVP